MVGTVFKEKHKAILSYWQSHKTFPFPILIDIQFDMHINYLSYFNAIGTFTKLQTTQGETRTLPLLINKVKSLQTNLFRIGTVSGPSSYRPIYHIKAWCLCLVYK